MMGDAPYDDTGARALLRLETGTPAAAVGHDVELQRRRASLAALVDQVAALFHAYGLPAARKVHNEGTDVWAFLRPHQPSLFVRVSADSRLAAYTDLLLAHTEVPLDAALLYDRATDTWFGAETTGRNLHHAGGAAVYESPVETITRAILHAMAQRR